MKQLLEIKSIPIALDIKTNPARCESKPASEELILDKGTLIIHKEPVKVDSIETNQSNTQEGDMMSNTANINTFGDMAIERMTDNTNTKIGFAPTIPVRINYEPQKSQMQFETDQLSFEWRPSEDSEVKFVPGNIEFAVKEYPRLEIEYIGGFIYIPKSADPNYEPSSFDVQA